MKTKKKYKAKSRIKKISYIVITICVICVSIMPCYAFTEIDATATNYNGVPIYLTTITTGYFIDETNGTEHFSDSHSWGAPLTYQEYEYTIMEDDVPFNYLEASNYLDIQSITIEMAKNRVSDMNADYICTGFHTDYAISCGNFLIDTYEDAFNFSIKSNLKQDYAIAGSYTIIDNSGNSENNIKYFAYNGTTNNIGNDLYGMSFNIPEYVSDTINYDSTILVNALTIEWKTSELVTDQIITQIDWEQSESVYERNLNAARINYDGTVSNSELNYYNTISEFFENIGITKYKSSFINYTADYTSFIGEAVGGFLNMEIFPYFSIGGILLICVALGLVGYFLKVFMGG